VSKSDYLARIAGLLGFLNEADRVDVLSDIEELYDGLAGNGMDDAAIRERIGAPEEVAAEYRLEHQLDRLDRSPGAAAGIRVGLAALTGNVARGAAFQLFGLLWLSLAAAAFGAILLLAAGTALAVSALAGFEPVVTTLSVPGMPIVTGVLIGIAVSVAGFAFLIMNRLAMRFLSRLMRERLRRRPGPAVTGEGEVFRSPLPRPAGMAAVRKRWVNTWRAAWQSAAASIVIALIGALLMIALPAAEYPLTIDRLEVLELALAEEIEIVARNVDVRVVEGDAPAVRLSAELRRTFGQSTGLSLVPDDRAILVEAVYREGLSWGINPRPLLDVTLPASTAMRVLIVLHGGGTTDLSALPEQVRGQVKVGRSED
jgi:uncharacterized membrane protein